MGEGGEVSASELEMETNQNIIFITEEEHSRTDWTYKATKELLKIYDEKSDMLDTGIITTQKKLWELTSKALTKSGYPYSASQCENKWKALKRSYKTKLERVQRFGSTRRPCPFEYEVGEILSKRPNDSFSRSYSVKIGELKKQDDLFRINLNEPPGYTRDGRTTVHPDFVNVKNISLVADERDNIKVEPEESEATYTVIQDANQTALIDEISILRTTLVKHNKINTSCLKQMNDTQEKILEYLAKAVLGQREMKIIEEKKLQQQSEIAEQMKVQNELLQKLLEKFSG